jgi:hypothetical protein
LIVGNMRYRGFWRFFLDARTAHWTAQKLGLFVM